MQKRGFFDFLSELIRLFWEVSIAGARLTIETARAYLEVIKTAAKYTVIIVAISVIMMVLGVYFQLRALNALSVLLVGLVICAWSIILWPVEVIRRIFRDIGRAIDAVARAISVTACVTILISTYFFTVKVWNKPELIPLTLTTLLGLFYVYTDRRGFDKKALRGKLVALAIFLTINFTYPNWDQYVAEILAQIKVTEQAEVVKAEPLLQEAQASTVASDENFKSTLELPKPPRAR